MAFAKAERAQLYLRCALFGPSGSGKTMTALRMAKGIADKMGVPVAVIDTEARSASKYADWYSFIVDNLEGKTIDHYLASMKAAREAGYKVLVIDSLSHAWRELTEEVDRLTLSSTSKNSFLSWGKVGPKQKRFIDAILNYPGHIIATMRSKTEWVIGEGRNGKTAPEKLGLAPEQGKGIEYEFDLLLEMNQNHHALVTKDRTGKFQDETIEKPGEDFGLALYEWLSTGKMEIPATPAQAVRPPAKHQEAATANTKSNPEQPAATGGNALKEQGDGVIQEIGKIITATAKEGAPYFTEDEKEEARQIIRETRLDDKGLSDLREFKIFLSEELAKRESKKAA
ncbi:MAG: ATP-binding protein [Treponema sp.]|jgi:hypothetical protein|nr:ATP-binding protein [Treponema sp.]